MGDAVGVHKAIELIASHLRKFLVDRSIIPIFEMHVSMHFSLNCNNSNQLSTFVLNETRDDHILCQMQMANPQMEHAPPHQQWGPPQGLPHNAGGGPGFGPPNPQYMPPPRQHDNYYPPADMPPPIEK